MWAAKLLGFGVDPMVYDTTAEQQEWLQAVIVTALDDRVEWTSQVLRAVFGGG